MHLDFFNSAMNSARSRAKSEPEIHRLNAAESRPVSSYEYRQKDAQVDDFSPLVVQTLAIALGVDLNSHASCDWIVRDCLIKLKEEGWMCSVICHGNVNELLVVNTVTAEKRSTHEIIEIHREFTERILFEQKMLETKRLDPLYRVKELVYNQLMGIKDSRQMTSPRLVEAILSLLKINVLHEFFLAKVLRQELDGAYFEMVDAGGPNKVSVETCIDLHKVLGAIANERLRYLRQISESHLLFCVECRHSLADGICASCGDCFCGPCHSRLHSKGTRLDHLFVFVEQAICSECRSKSADLRCTDCQDMFCKDCFKSVHARGKHTKHCIRLPFSTICFDCAVQEASVICFECEDIACLPCALRIHRGGARVFHQLYGLRKAGYRKKLFACNADAVLMIIDQFINTSVEHASPWELFYDERTEPFWYNFFTREVIKTSMSAIFKQPDMHADQARELRTITEIRAKQRATFDVPEAIGIKFQPVRDC